MLCPGRRAIRTNSRTRYVEATLPMGLRSRSAVGARLDYRSFLAVARERCVLERRNTTDRSAAQETGATRSSRDSGRHPLGTLSFGSEMSPAWCVGGRGEPGNGLPRVSVDGYGRLNSSRLVTGRSPNGR